MRKKIGLYKRMAAKALAVTMVVNLTSVNITALAAGASVYEGEESSNPAEVSETEKQNISGEIWGGGKRERF